jgi:hypothetical protein
VSGIPDQNPDPPVEYEGLPSSKTYQRVNWSRATQRRLLRGMIHAFEVVDPSTTYVSGYVIAASVSLALSAFADEEEWR